MRIVVMRNDKPYFRFPISDAIFYPLHKLLEDPQLISLRRVIIHGILGKDFRV